MAGGTGELVIGDVDPAHYIGELRHRSVPNMVSCRMSYWEVEMDAWGIGSITMGYTDMTVMDSDASPFVVTSDAIKSSQRLLEPWKSFQSRLSTRRISLIASLLVPIWTSFSVASLTLRPMLTMPVLISTCERLLLSLDV